VAGNSRVSREEVLALAGLAPGSNIFAFDENAVIKTLELHPMIKNVEVKRKINMSVAIQVEERKVWAIIPYGELFLCIDDQGICFDKLNMTPVDNCPIITLQTPPEYVSLGQAVNIQATNMVCQVWKAIPAEERPYISEFHYINDDGTLQIYTINGTEVRFGNLERLDEKAKTFAQVIQLENDTDEQGRDVLEYVDIRFKHITALMCLST
jgi:cell division protein FtsQ